MENIYLLGYMGTGKTSTGKIIASKLGMQFIDLDDFIENSEGLTISDIFKQKGQDYFRDLETEALREVSLFSNMVIACGGGIVLRAENLEVMESKGLPVCLDAAPGVIYQRTRKSSQRPLLNVKNPQEVIKSMLLKRGPFYKKIKYHVDTSGLTIAQTADKIIAIYKSHNRKE
jgi:shikimate kinase